MFILCFAQHSWAQQPNFFSRSEIGFTVGTTFYLGDLNQFKPFYKSNLAGGFMYRFNVHSRMTLRFTGIYGKVEAYDKDASQPLIVNRNLSFESPITELAGGIEFHYFPFQFGNKRYKGTSYMITQIGVFQMNPQTQYNGELVELQPLGTEGQNVNTGKANYGRYQLCVPLGLGLKLSMGKYFSFNMEIAIRKTFTDYLDDVSTTYPGNNLVDMSNASYEMSDPSRTHLSGDQRGNPDKKDWYSFAGITLSFKLGNKTEGCDY